DPRAALHAAAARAHRAGRARSELHHHPPPAAVGGGRGLHHLPEQGRRLHEGGAGSVAPESSGILASMRYAVLLLLLAPVTATAQDVVLDEDVPADAPPYFEVTFTVPPGTMEIEVRHDDGSDANI